MAHRIFLAAFCPSGQNAARITPLQASSDWIHESHQPLQQKANLYPRSRRERESHAGCQSLVNPFGVVNLIEGNVAEKFSQQKICLIKITG